MLLKLLPAVARQQSSRFCLIGWRNADMSSSCHAVTGEAAHKTADQKAEQLLEEAARQLGSKDREVNWESSMAAIRRTEQLIPSEKPSPEQLLKIREASVHLLHRNDK